MYPCLRTIQNRWVEVFGLAHTLYWSVFHGPLLPFSLYHLQFHSKWRDTSQFSEKQVNTYLLENVSKLVTSVRNSFDINLSLPRQGWLLGLESQAQGPVRWLIGEGGLLASLITWAQWAGLMVERDNSFVELLSWLTQYFKSFCVSSHPSQTKSITKKRFSDTREFKVF